MQNSPPSQGLVDDPSLHIGLLSWACRTLGETNDILGLKNTTDRLAIFCADVDKNLAPPSVSTIHGGLITGHGVADDPTTSTLQDMEAFWPAYPLHTVTVFGSGNDAEIVRNTGKIVILSRFACCPSR